MGVDTAVEVIERHDGDAGGHDDADAARDGVVAVAVAAADLSGNPDEHRRHAEQLSAGKQRHRASPRTQPRKRDQGEPDGKESHPQWKRPGDERAHHSDDTEAEADHSRRRTLLPSAHTPDGRHCERGAEHERDGIDEVGDFPVVARVLDEDPPEPIAAHDEPGEGSKQAERPNGIRGHRALLLRRGVDLQTRTGRFRVTTAVARTPIAVGDRLCPLAPTAAPTTPRSTWTGRVWDQNVRTRRNNPSRWCTSPTLCRRIGTSTTELEKNFQKSSASPKPGRTGVQFAPHISATHS